MESNHESLPWTTNKVSSMYSHVQVCWWIMFLVVMLTYIWREPNVPYAQRLATTEILFIHRKREVEHNTKKRNSTQEVNVENPKLGGKTTAAHRLQTITMMECTTLSSLRHRPRAHRSSPQAAVTTEATTSFSLSLSVQLRTLSILEPTRMTTTKSLP